MVLLLLIVIYISFISLGLPDSLLGSAWPSMYRGMAVPLSYAGILAMVIAGGTIISSAFSDRIIKRFGTGMVTVISVLMTALALWGFSISSNFISLCIWAIPLGLGAGSVDAALNNYVALHYQAKHMNWLHCFWGIGATIGPVIMSFFLVQGGLWHLGYRTISMMQFCLVVMLLFSLPLWSKVAGRAVSLVETNQSALKFSGLLRLPGAKPALVSFFCYCAVEATVGLWGGSYLVFVKDIAPATAAKWISLFYFGITCGRMISGFLTMRFNQCRMIRLGQGVLAGGIVFLYLPWGNAALLTGFFLLGLGCAPIYPCLLHETPDNFGREHSQAIMGLQMACAYVGSTFMPPLFGTIAAHLSYRLFPSYIGLLLVVMVIMVEILNKRVSVAGQR